MKYTSRNEPSRVRWGVQRPLMSPLPMGIHSQAQYAEQSPVLQMLGPLQLAAAAAAARVPQCKPYEPLH